MQKRIRKILGDLEAVQENLLALSDDIWLNIDHNDPQGLEDGYKFKKAYNEKIAEFSQISDCISNLVQQYTNVKTSIDEASGNNEEQNDRIVRELNHEEPHRLDEDFTYKRPYGFILEGKGTTGVTTWKRLYELISRELFSKDPERFMGLTEDPDFITNRNNHYFSRNPDELRSSFEIAEGFYAEVNLSANSITNLLEQLLAAHDISADNVQIFLREDRNA